MSSLNNGVGDMTDKKYDSLKLCNQLCFPLYAASREITRKYKPFLDKLDLTYTQYITMLVLWEHGRISVSELGEYLYLDSGTLTPLLKKLEKKNLITRNRSRDDERVLYVTLTDEGLAMREEALAVPEGMKCNVTLTPEESAELYRILYKLLKSEDIAK